jgi:curli biogenesis system outer membrane secretion channel CsgG
MKETSMIRRLFRPTLLAIACAASIAVYAEGQPAQVDRSDTSQKLDSLGPATSATPRPYVTVYEVVSNVSEIDPRAATTMFTTALVKSRKFRVLERSRIAAAVARERELNAGGITSGDAATKALKGAAVVFEATFTEATASKSTSSGGVSIGGLNMGGGSNEDAIGMDVRVLSVATGEVFDAINVRKSIEASSRTMSGVGSLLDNIASQRGKNLRGLTPDVNYQSSRKESVDQAMRAVIELAVFELARRAAEWPAD